ncbi:MAG TPA: hypothetical protein PLF78_09420 [Caulobacter sp.]|nr:hypothetical protein [Caulobacter sp.]
MRLAASIAGVALVLLAIAPASACIPAPGWPDKVRLDPRGAATTLVVASGSIDIAVLESVSDDFEAGTTASAIEDATANIMGVDPPATPPAPAEVTAMLREDWVDEGRRFHFRVVERLAGEGSATFSLNGFDPSWALEKPRPPLRPVSATAALRNLNRYLEVRDLSTWQGFGACITPLSGREGQLFLVFRSNDGALLRQDVPIRFRGEAYEVGGPVFVPIRGVDDAWLAVVRRAITDGGKR